MTRLPPFGPLLLAALLATALPASAQYKVIGSDGSVTYTDRPPTASNVKVTPMRQKGGPAAAEAELPFDLRQVTTRFPVTLYTAADCTPCETGRQFLQQRGVPFTERRIVSEEDATALERTVGGRTVPALTVGAQALRGLSQTDWTAFLDAAGYPRESRLPRSYQAPAATPLVERAAPVARAPVAPPPAVATVPDTPPPDSSIKF